MLIDNFSYFTTIFGLVQGLARYTDDIVFPILVVIEVIEDAAAFRRLHIINNKESISKPLASVSR